MMGISQNATCSTCTTRHTRFKLGTQGIERVRRMSRDVAAKVININKNQGNIITGSTFALLAALTITVASSAVQGLEQRWPDMELNIFRWSFMIIALSIYFIKKKEAPSIPKEKIVYVLFYGALVSAEQVIFFTAVNFLPLGLMAALFRISLVSMAAIASRLIEKEDLSIYRILAVVLGIVGIGMMTQPEFIFGDKDDENDFNETDVKANVTSFACCNVSNKDDKGESRSLISMDGLTEDEILYIGISLTIFAAFLGVLQGVCMKRKSLVDYCVWKISFWVGVMGLIWTTTMSFAFEDVVFIVTLKDLSLVACYAILASAHSFSFLYALKKSSYLIVAIIMVNQIVFNLVAQYTVMKDIFPGKNNVFEVIGGVLVMVAAALPTIREGIRERGLKCCGVRLIRRESSIVKRGKTDGETCKTDPEKCDAERPPGNDKIEKTKDNTSEPKGREETHIFYVT